MQQIVSLREANQHLSRYVEAVESGAEIVITRRGQPVARLVPVSARERITTEQRQARKRALDRMRRGYPLGGKGVDREEIYGG